MEEISLFEVRRKDCKKRGEGYRLYQQIIFLKKIWSENNTYTLEFLKIAYPFIGSPNMQL